MKIYSRRRRSQIDNLPDEIMEKILSILPTKSLLRFKSVCRQWLSLISHPRFVQSHLKLVLSSVHHNHKIMAISSDYSQFHLLNPDGNQQKFNLPLSPTPPDHVPLLGSCNGLLCLGIYTMFDPMNADMDMLEYGFNPILWNPLLNDYRKIPFFVLVALDSFAFGYDSHTEDYKFVRVKTYEGEAEVYSLKSASKRSLPLPLVLDPRIGNGKTHYVIDPYFDSMHRIGRYFNGSIYWLSLQRGLIVFNLRYENFSFIKFPEIYTFPIEEYKFTIVRDCQLGIFFYEPENEVFNLMTIKEDNLNGVSWSMIEIQNPQGMLSWPICVMMNGEILMKVKNKDFSSPQNPESHPKNETFPLPPNQKSDLIIYNDEKKTINNAIHGAEDWCEYITYIETLILPSKLIPSELTDVLDDKRVNVSTKTLVLPRRLSKARSVNFKALDKLFRSWPKFG